MIERTRRTSSFFTIQRTCVDIGFAKPLHFIVPVSESGCDRAAIIGDFYHTAGWCEKVVGYLTETVSHVFT